MTRYTHSRPLRASSIFLAVSPGLKPPLLAQILMPSASSTFSSTAAWGHGQWCGKWTQARVSGQRKFEHLAGCYVSIGSGESLDIKGSSRGNPAY
jgi:hypothetical protein